MWDWYNRPGGMARLRTRTVILVLVIGGLVVGVFFTLLFFFLAPLIFRKVPAR